MTYLCNRNPNYITVVNDKNILVHFKIIVDKVDQLRIPYKLSELYNVSENDIKPTSLCPICLNKPDNGVTICRLSHCIYCMNCIQIAWKVNPSYDYTISKWLSL